MLQILSLILLLNDKWLAIPDPIAKHADIDAVSKRLRLRAVSNEVYSAGGYSGYFLSDLNSGIVIGLSCQLDDSRRFMVRHIKIRVRTREDVGFFFLKGP